MNYTYKTEPYKHQRDAFEAERRPEELCVLHGDGLWQVESSDRQRRLSVRGRAYHFSCDRSTEGRLPELGAERDTSAHARACAALCCNVAFRSEQSTTKLMDALLHYHDGLRVLVVNVEAFVSDKCVRYVHEFMDKEDVLFAVDESTTIKNHKAKRTRIVTGWRSLVSIVGF